MFCYCVPYCAVLWKKKKTSDDQIRINRKKASLLSNVKYFKKGHVVFIWTF